MPARRSNRRRERVVAGVSDTAMARSFNRRDFDYPKTWYCRAESLSRGGPERMLEAEVEEDRLTTVARSDFHRKRKTVNDLEVVAVLGEAGAGAEDEALLVRDAAAGGEGLGPIPPRLQHQVEGRPGEPDQPLRGEDGVEIRLRAALAVGTEGASAAEVPVRHQAVHDDERDRQVELDARSTRAEPVVDVARRQQHAHSRRERQPRAAVAEQLVAVVDRDVAEPAVAVSARERHGVAQLVAEAGRRPLLREVEAPVAAVARQLEHADVLDDAGLLVVGLLDEKAVVLNGAFLRDRRRAREDGQRDELDPDRHGDASHGALPMANFRV